MEGEATTTKRFPVDKPSGDVENDVEKVYEDLPTLAEIRKAIPKELFDRPLATSLFYLVRDIVIVGSLICAAAWGIPMLPTVHLRAVAWCVYWYCCGTAAVGFWILAHECGHGAFSRYRTLNHAIGLVLHTLVLIPYHSWRITHAKHHKYTNHCEKDTAFVPRLEPKSTCQPSMAGAVMDAPIVSFFVYSLVGWPLYLCTNLSGQRYAEFTSHYWPNSPIFKPEHRNLVLVSDAALLCWLSVLVGMGLYISAWGVFTHFVMPYLVVNYWLVAITYLQHTYSTIPHYRDGAWTFVRGATATVDIDMGFVINSLQHNISDAHVAHHLFSSMPFYNTEKATPYVRKALGKYYRSRKAGFVPLEVISVMADCAFVNSEGARVHYQKTHVTLSTYINAALKKLSLKRD
mmetsp:Transcript_30622/g.85768  ORF Transcript_30622/g.85768 Transcript_30622/m.85768 type:complete len:403 (+) Transcript_30622:385-1593(+)|eukprot:CAMPEP_0119133198 /NCGR_PEP_ID=MMETSP1310-20130426/13228_1 /TAXON_ID=464262 /ORGANISM="Genus nov. species nov., Strain RCC2339" /LENGTH=402 /DNA_ID=CAMNT_0007123885 /DNA_START=318 /DNA_END=1526 /DNA_ORIENTATION=-